MKIMIYMLVYFLCLYTPLNTSSATGILEKLPQQGPKPHQQRQGEVVKPRDIIEEDTIPKKSVSTTQKFVEKTQKKGRIVRDKIKRLEELKVILNEGEDDENRKKEEERFNKHIGKLKELLKSIPDLDEEQILQKYNKINEKFNPFSSKGLF